MRKSTISGSIAVLAATTLSAQQGPAIRQLGATVATSSEAFGQNLTLRHLKNGVLVNDVQNRRLLYLDNNLANPTVVADTTPETGTAYAGRTAGLVSYKGDSSLFIDPASLSMLVIDGSGKLTGKVMSVPRSQDVGFMVATGGAGYDPSGSFVYRGMPRPVMRPPAQSANGAPVFSAPEIPDSTAVVRVNMATRALDTLGFVKTPKIKMNMESLPNGGMRMSSMINPLPMVDDYALLPDGSVALIRGRDYHIDWVRPNGTRESSAKIPFDWRRLSDEDKVAFLDSVKAQRERMGANAPMPAGMSGTPNIQMQFGGGGGGGGGGGRQQIQMGDGAQPRPRPDGAGGAPGAAAPGGQTTVQGGGPGGLSPAPLVFVGPEELPDYQPVFFSGASRVDGEGRIWIRTVPTKALPGGPVYDVIDGKGALVERVQVPADRSIVGFGAGGVVYLRVGTTNKIEKANAK
jgi:hypothetical protein